MAQASAIIKAMAGIAYYPVTFSEVLTGKLLLTTDLSGRDLIKLLLPGLLWVWLLPNSTKLRFYGNNFLLALIQASATVYFLYLTIDQFGNYSPFLYFQF
jgi:hypothetical protein